MNRRTVLYTCTIVLCGAATVHALTLNDGLIAHYALDDIAGPVLDSADSHDGVNNGAVRGVPGKIGNAFHFDGTDDYVDTLPPSDIPTESTISLWVYPTDTTPSGNFQIFGSVENASCCKDGILLNYDTANQIITAFYVESNIDLGTAISSANSVPLDAWTQVTYTWDPVNNVRLYVNGSLDSTGTFSVPPSSHDRSLMFGKSILSQDLAFDGLLDDIKIWNRALSASEVARLVPEPSSLVLLVIMVVGLQVRRQRHR